MCATVKQLVSSGQPQLPHSCEIDLDATEIAVMQQKCEVSLDAAMMCSKAGCGVDVKYSLTQVLPVTR